MVKFIDLNADLGEGCPFDAQLLTYVSSANIACGAHAGDVNTMTFAVKQAIKHNVAIGAHPGFPDKSNFGRQIMRLTSKQLYTSVFEQLITLNDICVAQQTNLLHVKPHGALYNLAAVDEHVAQCIVNTIKDFNPTLKVMGLSGGKLNVIAKQNGLITINEGFADRTYTNTGTLVSRSEQHSVINNETQVLEQVLRMIKHQQVTSIDGKTLNLNINSICLHGDNQHAVGFAKKITDMLKQQKITVSAVE